MNLYDTIKQAIYQHENSIRIDGNESEEDIRYAVRWVMRDNPDIFWFVHQYWFDRDSSRIFFRYQFSKERRNFLQRSIDDVVANDFQIDHVRTLDIKSQVIYVYKWLLSYCNYNVHSAYNQSTDSVFVRRNSVSIGYAKAAQYLFKLLGIESRLVFGRLNNDKEEGRHCWNLVLIEGNYYHMDVCMGDVALEDTLKAAGSESPLRYGDFNYNCFCVSTEEILKTRSVEDLETLPKSHKNLLTNAEIEELSHLDIKERNGLQGCLLTSGSTADVFLCAKNKHVVLKKFRGDSHGIRNEYYCMRELKFGTHLLQMHEPYTDIYDNVIAIEQATPIVDLFFSHYYHPTLRDILTMIRDITLGWKECLEQGILYRDIHVCNIYKSDGTYKLGDFGSCIRLYRRLQDEVKSPCLIAPEQIQDKVGSPWFMAPETYKSGQFDECSAVYSITSVLYFVLNGLKPPFVTGLDVHRTMCLDEVEAIMQKKLKGEEFPKPSSLCLSNGMIESHMWDIIVRGCTCDRSRRIRSIDELLGMIEYSLRIKGVEQEFLPGDSFNEHLFKIRYVRTPNDATMRYAHNDEAFSSLKKRRQKKGNKMFSLRKASDELEQEESESGEVPICAVEYSKSKTSFWSRLLDFSSPMEGRQNEENEKNHCMQIESQDESYSSPMEDSGMPYTFDMETGRFVQTDNGELEQEENNMEELPMCIEGFSKPKASFWSRLFKKKRGCDDVYSSIFAPAEVRRKSHLLVQVYLHLLEETEKVKALARESQKDAERRDYIPLQCKLKKGDRVEVFMNIYGDRLLMSEKKCVIWQGSFTKCSFDYFVSDESDVAELSCRAMLTVNGMPVGEMSFITAIVEKPGKLSQKVNARQYRKIFISYSRKDEAKVRPWAEAYKAQGVDYFFDRDSIKPGDVFPKKIQDYINSADLFVLFWSENAAQSEYVERERHCALERAYPKVKPIEMAPLSIYPKSIEPRTALPDDMKDIYDFEIS